MTCLPHSSCNIKEPRCKTGMLHTAACGLVEKGPFVVHRCRRGFSEKGKVKGPDVPYRKLHTSQMNR